MSPVTLGGIATAAGGLLLVGVGVAAGRWQTRRERAAYRAYAARLEIQLAEAERIIGGLTDARLADAEPFPRNVQVPPRVWAALQEVRENPEAN